VSQFQGKKVGATKIKLTGGAQETFEDVPEIDQIVSVVIDGRVTGVTYAVNEQTGELEQTVQVKVLDMGGIQTQASPKLSMVDGKAMTS
jgi:hypothetical protein